MSVKNAKIHELPSITFDKIAAGEVIERPVSIIKELIENSIDAGASSITVEIKKGGKSYIRVTDDGSGILKEDVKLAFKRHATSKLYTITDLDTIATLGFRGEALASIASISRTELITCTRNDATGTCLYIEGGVITDTGEIGCQIGTTIIVKDLFYNTPARFKFMKKDNAESSLIIDFVSKIALAYPHIRIRLINNDSTLFSTPGKGDRFSTIATIYDPQMAEKLIKIDVEKENGMKLEGYISAPDATRASRINQIFFVNGRYVQNKIIEKAVKDAYREKVFEGRYPLAFLFLTVNPQTLDVNIHPNKKDIKFDDEISVKDFIEDAIRRGLSRPEAVPEIHFRQDKKSENIINEDKKLLPIKTNQEQFDVQKLLNLERKKENLKKSGFNQIYENNKFEKLEEENIAYTFIKENRDSIISSKNIFHLKPPETKPFDIYGIKPIGTIFSTYILGCDADTFYMIDQHAAHERVFYEEFCKKFYEEDNISQILALPIPIDTVPSVVNVQDDWMQFLKNSGFKIEIFGPQTYLIREIPMYMEMAEAERFVKDFLDNIKGADDFKDQNRINLLITRACKSAVKANDSLDMTEVENLLRDLGNCINPFSCPHGRPTIIKLKRTEIEALFKR